MIVTESIMSNAKPRTVTNLTLDLSATSSTVSTNGWVYGAVMKDVRTEL